MVVWRPLVSRTVNLHTGTMGVHRACFSSIGPAKSPPWSRIAPERFFPALCNLSITAHQLASARNFPLPVPAPPGLPLRLRRRGAPAGKRRLLRGEVLADLSDGVEDGLVQLREDVEATD